VVPRQRLRLLAGESETNRSRFAFGRSTRALRTASSAHRRNTRRRPVASASAANSGGISGSFVTAAGSNRICRLGRCVHQVTHMGHLNCGFCEQSPTLCRFHELGRRPACCPGRGISRRGFGYLDIWATSLRAGPPRKKGRHTAGCARPFSSGDEAGRLGVPPGAVSHAGFGPRVGFGADDAHGTARSPRMPKRSRRQGCLQSGRTRRRCQRP